MALFSSRIATSSIHWGSIHWCSIHWGSIHWGSILWGFILSGFTLSSLLGCGEAPTPDRQHYMAALENPARAVTLCEPIADVDTKAGCLAWAAWDLASEGRIPPARSVCTVVNEASAWASVCWFLVADSGNATPLTTAEMCSRAGNLDEPCTERAIDRLVGAITAETKVGEEKELKVQLATALEPFMDGAKSRIRASELVVAIITNRDPEQPLSTGQCGNATRLLCARVYNKRLTAALEAVPEGTTATWREQLCESDRDVAAAQELGMPLWADDVDEAVQMSLRMACGRSAGGRRGIQNSKAREQLIGRRSGQAKGKRKGGKGKGGPAGVGLRGIRGGD